MKTVQKPFLQQTPSNWNLASHKTQTKYLQPSDTISLYFTFCENVRKKLKKKQVSAIGNLPLLVVNIWESLFLRFVFLRSDFGNVK